MSEEKKELIISEQGIIETKSVEDLYRISTALCNSGMLPKTYDTPAKVMAGIAMIRELGLAPINGLKNLAVINGTPSLYGELPLALVRKSGLLEYFNEFLIDKDYKKICFENKNLESEIFASVCELKRVGQDKKTFSYTIHDAAKNPNSKNQVWSSYRPIMFKRKARAIALKDEFGDILGGVTIAEYDHDQIPRAGESIECRYSSDTNSEDKKLTDLLNDKIINNSEKLDEA